MNNILYIHGII